MYVVVGLGNPGKKYEKTRHNVGFDVIDILAKEYNISVTKIKHKALIGEGRVGTEKVLLVKPQTYMNLSGETLIDIYKYYKVDLSNIVVVYDDIDLEVGKIRIRKKGSGGTHNGMKSITKCLGSNDFPRVRVGVSKPEAGQDLADFVLSRFRKEESDNINEALEKAAYAIDSIIRENIDMSMNKYNG
ncbi:TPA: aminoacyl-tRNA hydrolase [Clostridioides difficile]|uniref:aminoacyl-tRNA hydrolase n=1 Tax=Clostridioides difficile TaxID=1496 RepID=UPI00038D8842|nr:aminoacyl-tRNA hydrolase [Clostridioides difficile]OFU34061.1 aminoacyl-tRNA hydrolase [Clostridium sp. HMSC19B11]EGT2205004.1 aminoacyl-tRNA hydrolase [Clostridioides difficile]EGT3659881.1 aminoacyl-tRNA hydrolase [Clostridioides difficile]EGT3687018.1 aminoacyl-tRNA hydrolase [Clostridioides difficile]EGT3784618.1 aminoacyl-tRNA hydrolase [Clostridioides difficile]